MNICRLHLFLSLLLTVLPAHAISISWFNAEGDLVVNSTGTALDSTFKFEIGTFDTSGGWAPTSGNISEWEARWRVFDRAQTGDGWNATNSYFTSGAQFQETLSPTVGSSSFNGQNFTAGETAYLWVYNALSLTPGSEWALVRDASGSGPFSPSWVMPTPNDSDFNSIDWDLLEADSAVLGQVNGVLGGGDFNPIGNPGGGVAWLQTAAVPEPGSALLLLLTGLLFLRRHQSVA